MLTAQEDGVPKLYFGLSHFAVGDFAYASYAIRRAMDRGPEWGRDEADLRGLYGNSTHFDRHLAVLRTHVQRFPEDGDARFLRGYILFSTAQYDLAIEQLEAALVIKSDDRHAASLLRTVIGRSGRVASGSTLQEFQR